MSLPGPGSALLQRARSFSLRVPLGRPFGLRTKIGLLVICNVAGVLFLASAIDFHLSRKDQIDLYLNRNLYIAKQIDLIVPDERLRSSLPTVRDEVEEWLLSRPSLVRIDLFLFTAKGLEPIVSLSKWNEPSETLTLSKDQASRLKSDLHLYLLKKVDDAELLEVIVPMHSGKKVIGGILLASTLEEVRGYLNKKRERTLILTLSSIFVILATLTIFFGRWVGLPLGQIMGAMTRAEKGDLDSRVELRTQDELGTLGNHFNRMIKTIREAHEQNVQLLSQIHQFNEELTRRIEAATSELARRNEELRLLNEALFDSQRQVSQSEKLAALGQVAATLAHQMGTPLNSISGYLQLIRMEGNLQPSDQERLKIIESQLDRLTDSVGNLLSFTRQPKPQLKPLKVNAVLEELIHLSEPWVHTRRVKLIAHLEPELPSVLGDGTQLQTLFLNLISNAVDAMPQGGVLTIRTRSKVPEALSGNGRWVEITVADTGIGITEESKRRIFTPFFTTKKIGEGTGLGLAICREIVKEHAGSLEVESEVGRGSFFFVLLPVPKTEAAYEQRINPSAGRG
jgi:two-component system NtrC family sensor kinase